MSRPRFRARGRVAPRPGRHWVGVANATTVAPGNIDEQPLVVSTDFANNTDLSPGKVTLARIVGSFVIRPAAPVSGQYRWTAGIVLIDDDETPVFGGEFDPTQTLSLTRDRWIWGPYVQVVNYGSTAPTVANDIYMPVVLNVKQKVVLKDQGISLVWTCETNSPSSMVILTRTRCLLLGDTN